MSVTIDELTSTVETEPSAAAEPAGAPAPPSPDEANRRYRELARHLRRDAARTRVEAYDD